MILNGKRIFIVEDNPANLLIMQVTLEQNGAKTTFERWGIETVERLRESMPVDLIIMDLMFPENITGFDIFKQIQQEPDLADIPAVVVSAADAMTSVPKAQSAGFAGFIAKPIDYDIFPKQIVQILNREQAFLTG